jgi:hypothetical protein
MQEGLHDVRAILSDGHRLLNFVGHGCVFPRSWGDGVAGQMSFRR